MRVHYVQALRRDLCGQLAWLEDEPSVAVSLIEESLSSLSTADDRGAAYAAMNALELAVVTGSNAMAGVYCRRFRDRWAEFIELRGSEFPHAADWLAQEMGDAEPES